MNHQNTLWSTLLVALGGFLFSLILTTLFTTAIPSIHADVTLSTNKNLACMSFQFATRTGKNPCWTQLHLTQNQRLCISHALWLQWLDSPSSAAICPMLEIPWKKLSSFKNEPSVQPLLHQKPVLLTKKISSLSYILRSSTFEEFIFSSLKKIERLREQISSFLAPHDSLFILRSLILNEGNSKEPLPFLRKLGFVHLLSASGIHLYAVTYLIQQIIRFIISKISNSHPSHTFNPISTGLWISRILSIVLCSWIWLLSGTRLGLLRPWFVLFTKTASQFFGFRWNRIIPLVLALCVEGLLSAGSTSFWHSSLGANTGRWIYTLAVAGGLFWHSHFKSLHLGLAIGSWVPIALWEGWEHGSLSLATPILSLITLPIVCLGIYPLVLVSILLHFIHCPTLAQHLLSVLSGLLENLIYYTAQFALYPGNLWILPHWSLLGGFILALGLSLLSKPIPRMSITNIHIVYFKNLPITVSLIFILIGIRFLMPFCPLTQDRSAEPTSTPLATQIEQLDVGQGDSALIQSSLKKFKKSLQKNNGLIDTGSQRSLSDVQWFEVFTKRNIHQLDWLALSHLDEDHTGGLHRLSRLLPIRCVAIPDLLLHTQRSEILRHQLLPMQIPLMAWETGCIPFPGRSTQIGFQSVSKNPRRYNSKASYSKRLNQNPGNDIMGALLIPLQKGGFYLTAGDATRQEENQIAAWVHTQFNNNLSQSKRPGQRILKLSHHGSKTSTSLPWLQAIQPTDIWISVGLENRYHHPHPWVLEILENYGVPVYRTDQLGALRSI